jgi:hypothetical protein
MQGKQMSEQKSDHGPVKIGPGYLEIIAIAGMITIGILWGYDQFYAQKVLTFDLKGYLREQTALIKAGEMTEEQFKINLNKMEAVLDAEKGHHVIMLKDVVIRNGEEIPAR